MNNTFQTLLHIGSAVLPKYMFHCDLHTGSNKWRVVYAQTWSSVGFLFWYSSINKTFHCEMTFHCLVDLRCKSHDESAMCLNDLVFMCLCMSCQPSDHFNYPRYCQIIHDIRVMDIVTPLNFHFRVTTQVFTVSKLMRIAFQSTTFVQSLT